MAIQFWRAPGAGTQDTDPLLEAGLLPDNGKDDPESSSFNSESEEDEDEDHDVKEARAKRLKEIGWFGYLKDFSIFVQYIIPRNDLLAQFCIFASIIILVIERGMRIAIPYLLGLITDKVTSGIAPMRELTIFFIVDVISSESGIMMLQELSKIPIRRYSYEAITNAAFKHVMDQSIDFHSTQDSAEVMKSIEQGFALSNVLESAVFDILPTFADVFIACGVFYRKFNPAVAGVLFGAAVVYLTAEVFSAKMTVNDRRRMTKAERAQIRSMHQAIQGWQTVTFFNQFNKERRNLADAVKEHMQANTHFQAKRETIQGAVELLVPIAFYGLAFLILKEIAAGSATPGDFVFFLQYWDSIIYPLQFLSNHFRWIVMDFVDAERLLMLLKTEPSVKDSDMAGTLPRVQGDLEFKDVSLLYDEDRKALDGVSFEAHPGQTIALVGQTGAGKSSVLKLLLRLYDVTSGSISISGRDIRDVSLSSLREVLGVVPQTPVFFNASIMENVRYARSDATDEEVHAACRAAAIHDTIIQYKKGYDTQVGERGVKLSGGEAQRLAIARVLLKNAPIVLLDEATSAVDTLTEGKIKEAFEKLREDRIVIVIAHRLSTTVNADQILVFHEGKIVEKGSHAELCEKKGRYWEMWEQS